MFSANSPGFFAIPTVDLSVAEGCDSLDHTGDVLGRVPAFGDCGIHLVASYFSTDRVHCFDTRDLRPP